MITRKPLVGSLFLVAALSSCAEGSQTETSGGGGRDAVSSSSAGGAGSSSTNAASTSAASTSAASTSAGAGGGGGAGGAMMAASTGANMGCKPGDTQSCYTGPMGSENTGVCKNGTQICGADGSFGPCVGEVVPGAEVCDGLDNDCDSVADEGCAPVSFQNLIDFDAASDGSLFALGGSGNGLAGKCWNADGSVRRDTFTVVNDIYMGSGDGNGPQIVTARAAQISLVTWCSEANGFNNRVFRSQLLDASCQPIGGPFNWPPPASGEYDYDTAIDAQGNFVLAWKDPLSPQGATLHLSFYDATGAVIAQDLTVGECDASGSGYAMHVAVNPLTGAGLVSCQGHLFNTIRYRRFDANHNFIDPGMVDVAQTAQNHSSWYESHAIGVNDVGAFAIEWEDSSTKQFMANFYDAAGGFVATATIAPTDPNLYYDAFRYPHQAVQIDNGDFIFRDDPWAPQPVARFFRYTPGGVFVGCGSTMHKKQSLRTGGGVSLFMAEGNMILPSAVDVSNAACP